MNDYERDDGEDPDTIYRAFLDADTAWSAQLVRCFGKQAGDVRYTTRGNGEPGSELRRLDDLYTAARETWNTSREAAR